MKLTQGPIRAATGVLLLALAGLTQTPAALVAQTGGSRSVLELLPLQASTLAVGSEVAGTLSEADYRTTNAVLVQAFALEGGAGDPITVDLISDDFDAYLFLVGPGYDAPLTDDDSGGACHARLTLFLPENGPYRLVVGSWQSPGSYTLRVDSRAHSPAPGDCSGDEFGGEFFDEDMLAALTRIEPLGTLQPGTPIDGALSDDDATLPDDSRAEVWTLVGEPGQTLVVELISQSFDALLMRVPPGRDRYEMDDDSAGNCNSRMWVTFEGSEPHLIVVNSLGPDGRGGFTLRVSDQAGADAPGAC
jgi:hypothetical protein